MLSKNELPVKEEEIPKHRILRDLYRHYLEFRDLFNENGTHVIDHSYYVKDGDDLRKVDITISLWDLQDGLKKLAPRKQQAVFYNVILDKLQREVAEIMGITTVSVGQYVDHAMIQLAKEYWSEEVKETA